MKKLLIIIFIFLIFLECQNKKINSKKIKTNEKLTSDESSFNSITGEFVLDKNTILLWHFNEGKDIVLIDNSPNENFGILNNVRWNQGLFNNALKFDGKQSYVEVESSNSLLLKKAISIEIWILINKKQFENYPVIISKNSIFESSGQPSFEIFLINQIDDKLGKQLAWRISTENGEYTLPSSKSWSEIADKKWHYIVATYDGKIMKLYIDSKLSSSAKVTGNLITNDNPLFLSRKYEQGKNNFHGLMDELRISSVARSEKAIKKYWNNVKK